MGISGRGELQQVQRLAPPIANTEEDVVSHRLTETRELSDEVVGLVGAFVKTEDTQRPYSDREILDYMIKQGHANLGRRDVAYARTQLGIEPSSQRCSR